MHTVYTITTEPPSKFRLVSRANPDIAEVARIVIREENGGEAVAVQAYPNNSDHGGPIYHTAKDSHSALVHYRYAEKYHGLARELSEIIILQRQRDTE
jgi:hypothetical protein